MDESSEISRLLAYTDRLAHKLLLIRDMREMTSRNEIGWPIPINRAI